MTITRHATRDFTALVKEVARLDQDHFPERMGVCFILNAPGAFGLVWRIVRPWLDGATIRRIHVLGPKDDWRKVVATKCGREVLRNLDEGVDLDDAALDTSLKLKKDKTPQSVARMLVEHRDRLAELGADPEHRNAARRARNAFLTAPLKTSTDASSTEAGATTSVGNIQASTVSDAAENDFEAFADCVSPALSPREAMLELREADVRRSGKSVGWLATCLTRLVLLQVLATGSLFALALVALLDERFEWHPHLPEVGILLGVVSVMFAALGYVGASRLNLGVLRVHATAQGCLTVAFLVLACASLEVALGSSKGFFFSRAARANVRQHNLSVGLASLAELVVGVPQVTASVLLRRRLGILLSSKGFDDVADARFALKVNAGVLALLGLAGLSFASATVSYFVQHHLGAAAFAPYMLLEGSIALQVIAAVAKWCSVLGTRVQAVAGYARLARCACLYFGAASAVAVVVLLNIGDKVRRKGVEKKSVEARATGPLLLLATCDAVVAAALFASADSARKLHASRVQGREKERARRQALAVRRRHRQRRSEEEKKEDAGPLPLRAALRLVAEPGQLRDEDEAALGDDEDIQNAQFDDEADPDNTPPLTRYERGAVAWGLFTGLIHIFLDGTFAVFNHLVRFENEDGRLQRPWFVEAWHLWGNVDRRYRESDSFIVVQVAAMALVAGPACLIFAWATFERTVLRPALGVVMSTAQMWTLGLYFATEAHVDFEDCAKKSDFVKFWLLFVGTTVVRFLLPLPVLGGSVRGVMRDAEFHHRWHLQYRQLSTTELARALELEPALDDPL